MNNRLKQRKVKKPKNLKSIETNMWRSLVLNSQEEFRRQGWNVAGANLLSLAVGLANRHYLYVRPRLTPRDFGIALIPMVIGALLATLIAYCASGNIIIYEMAALGCVLGLMGELLLKELRNLVAFTHATFLICAFNMGQEKYEISIVVGAGAARRRRFVYNAACGCRTGTTWHSTAQPSADFTYFWLYKTRNVF